ncbi:MAG TPA: flagellar biosynthesis protein FlhB [Bdellovibrionales bacterium]|nr:flagellar biosynthesis protein FlhB [Bdellovibrionales bacterium]
MASEADQGERTEEATQQRREDFRKRGQVAQTKELSAVFMLFANVLIIWLLSRFAFQQFHELFTMTIGDDLVAAVRGGDYMHLATFAVNKTALLALPVMGVLWAIGLASSLVQVGFLYNEEALQWKWERMDPVAGFKKIFALRALIEGLKACLKLTLILLVSYYVLRNQLKVLPFLMDYSPMQIMEFLGSVTVRLLSGVGLFMLTLAGLDYFYQRWDLEKEMRMTKQEIKEEVKSREGDPMIRARIKRVQREFAQRRMMEEVPKADVIVTNPTHIAVALKYSENMVAPMVIAKGADLIAEKIREMAKEHAIPIIENKPLARTMFKTLKIGQAIPRELYTAVAEVLSYVYRLRRKKVR